MKYVLVDASFLIAVYDRSDHNHARCVRLLDGIDGDLVTCEAVLAESFHMLQSARGAAAAILASIESGALNVSFSLGESATAVRASMQKYADTPCDLADACLIAMADQLDTGDILTLDSDFRHYRWRHNKRFRLLIPLS